MKESDIKKKLHDYIEDADSDLLNLMESVVESYRKNHPVDYQLSDEQKAELDRRKEKHISGESTSYSWEEVKSKARQQSKK